MAKTLRKPRAKQAQRLKKENTEQVKESRVVKPAKKPTITTLSSTPSKHGMRTRARKIELSDEQQPASTPSNKSKILGDDDAYYTSLSQELKKTPKTSKSSKTSRGRNVAETPKTPPNPSNVIVWDLLDTERSFWDLIRETSSSQSSPGRSFADEDINIIMKRLNRQVAHRIDSYKVEDHGYLSSSSPGGHDPREQNPITEEEKEELQLALWPSLQHLAELTNCQPHHTDPSKCYLDQFRALFRELQDIWQVQGHNRSAPALFQLEAWKGGIVNWRSSHYTNGDERLSASVVVAHFENWRAEIPSPSPIIDYSMPDIDESDLEMQSINPRHYFHSSSPLYDRSSPYPQKGHRHVMSALYDQNRDIGFLPTPAQIRSYQSGESPSTTLPWLGLSDPGIIESGSSDPIQEAYYLGGNPNIDIYEGGNVTPPRSGDPPVYTSSQGSISSNKENDRELMAQVMEEQRREAREVELENAVWG
ncbi:MAG: hypothetical protein Q9209_002990 [Squamulea sp. 1 TL-2023]